VVQSPIGISKWNAANNILDGLDHAFLARVLGQLESMIDPKRECVV